MTRPNLFPDSSGCVPTESDALAWHVEIHPSAILCTFRITRHDGLLEPADLAAISLPPVGPEARTGGIVISGRGPIWLYAHLVHLAHPFAWVAVFDPRLNRGIVTQRHRPDSPTLGSLVDLSRSTP